MHWLASGNALSDEWLVYSFKLAAGLIIAGSIFYDIGFVFLSVGILVYWARLGWWFPLVLESGEERFSLFVVGPALTALAGAGAAVGLDHAISEGSDHDKQVGWVLLGASVLGILVVGTVLLRWLRWRGIVAEVRLAKETGIEAEEAVEYLRRHASPDSPLARPGRWFLVGLGYALLTAVCCLVEGSALSATITFPIVNFVLPVIMSLFASGQKSSTSPRMTRLIEDIGVAQLRVVKERADLERLSGPTPLSDSLWIPSGIGGVTKAQIDELVRREQRWSRRLRVD